MTTGGKAAAMDLVGVTNAKSLPGVTFWNRLEGRPRALAFDRALRAEVRDALWMLTRQWQLGEFHGDDAGSPIQVQVRIDTTRIRGYRPQTHAFEPFDDNTPLEARVEQLPVPFAAEGVDACLDLRLLMGRYWLKLLAPVAAEARSQYLTAYPVQAPDPTTDPVKAAAICAHAPAYSTYLAAAGRLLDGAKLYAHLKLGGHASDGITGLGGRAATVDALGERFVAWFDRLIYQPSQPPAWVADRLEYQFACSAPAIAPTSAATRQKVLAAEEYFHAHLDWYNLDVDRVAGAVASRGPADGATRAGAVQQHRFTMLPTAVTFNGMPNTRWWTFEDARTDFGDIRPDTTDLAKLLLIEFGLVYANDWFLAPFTVPAGTLAEVRGVAVTNVFGERTWIEPAGSGDDANWRRWAMYLMSVAGPGHQPADLSLAILPTAQQVLEGPPLDEVVLIRDEMANMVWAIEKAIPLPTGVAKPGSEAAHETRGFHLRNFERVHAHPPQPPAAAAGAAARYQLMTSVPENWIPLVPMHVPADTRQVQLRRAAMPRIFAGDTDPPAPVRPRTWLLRQGLDEKTPTGYRLHEEEVPRAGVRATRTFQRTRWRDGRVWVWLGARKETGRGEGSSGLAFDWIVDLPPPPSR